MTTAKRAVRSGAVWGALFGVLILNEALSYHKNFPTVASRERFAHTLGANSGMAAIIGPARQVGTLGGFVAWRVFGLLIIVGAIWGLLTATRLLRREEDAGRWELLLAGRTTRRHATVQAMAGLAAGWTVLWALTAALTVAAGSRPSVGFSASASVFYATAATASAAVFLGIGTLASQLAATRRQANGVAAAAFAVCYLIRMVADGVPGLGWLRWASPLGWVENLHPLTGSQPLALVPIIVLIAAAAGAAVTVAGRRDLGAAVLTRSQTGKASTRLLGGPAGLVTQLERWVALAWVGGLAGLALIFGVVARSAAAGNVAVATIEQTLGRLGGHPGGAVAAWIGYEFLYLAALLAFAAAGQISAIRSEEADGHLDNLLARHLNRTTWLAGRLGFGVALVIAAGLACGVGGWIGVATRHSGIGLATMLQAGLNVAVPALFILGVGALVYGLAPRLAVPVVYTVVLWSFLVEIIGSSITSNHWLIDTAVLSHLGPVPAASLDWTAIAALTGLGVIAALAGLAAFTRRDLAAA
ncbi:MAG TPA: ABC transporter permease subunit [Streptosporangiaceae bacterium]|nr:ABC transporter permease subunit [Streptosporangiaceae bacterium]